MASASSGLSGSVLGSCWPQDWCGELPQAGNCALPCSQTRGLRGAAPTCKPVSCSMSRGLWAEEASRPFSCGGPGRGLGCGARLQTWGLALERLWAPTWLGSTVRVECWRPGLPVVSGRSSTWAPSGPASFALTL